MFSSNPGHASEQRVDFLRSLTQSLTLKLESESDKISEKLSVAINAAFRRYDAERAAIMTAVRGDQTPVLVNQNPGMLEWIGASIQTSFQTARAVTKAAVDCSMSDRAQEIRLELERETESDKITPESAKRVFMLLRGDLDHRGWVGESKVRRASLNTLVTHFIFNELLKLDSVLLTRCNELFPECWNADIRENHLLLAYPQDAKAFYCMMLGVIHNTGQTQARFTPPI